jgi:hypothetical protein
MLEGFPSLSSLSRPGFAGFAGSRLALLLRTHVAATKNS